LSRGFDLSYQFGDSVFGVRKLDGSFCQFPVLAAVFRDDDGKISGTYGPAEKVFDLLLSEGDKSLLSCLTIGIETCPEIH
jgi:hypothetical protein